MINRLDRYTSVAILLHWLIAAGVLGQIALGWWMIDIPKLPPGVRAYWFNLHKSIGLTIALLVFVRILWRLAHRPPPLPNAVPAWQRRAAAVNHALLYGCLVVMPLAGYLGSTFSGYPIKYFGIALPNWGWDAPAFKALASTVHLGAAWLFMALIAVHIGAALKHWLVARDGVFERMLPRRRTESVVPALGAALLLLVAMWAALVLAQEKEQAHGEQAHKQQLHQEQDNFARAALLEEIGRRLFFDTRLSEPPGVACASCHEPQRAFSGDNGSGLPVARGSKPTSIGTRNAPTLMYLATAPAFGFITDRDDKRVPVGGFFWDGRAATLEAQATQPLLNPLEMNNADAASLAAKVSRGDHAVLMRRAFGNDVLADPQRALQAIALTLAAFQRTQAFAPFTSKFDYVMRGQAQFTEQEQRGLSLFTIRQKGNCAQCHTVDTDSRDPHKSLFTNFGYHALGVPRNGAVPRNADAAHVDLGLCGPTRTDLDGADGKHWCGFFKTPTLRNIAATAPYMHNGKFATLREAVAFYATRDTEPQRWYRGAKFDDLPAELHANVDRETPPYHREPGRRAPLNDEEIDDIVAFLQTLTDGYRPF
ncbi:MAG TPA: cytochrome c peroxidase [Burkholderiaceae bacterium]|nr:cytochrome c peroxidase [Burkholderiaceae bacterium]